MFPLFYKTSEKINVLIYFPTRIKQSLNLLSYKWEVFLFGKPGINHHFLHKEPIIWKRFSRISSTNSYPFLASRWIVAHYGYKGNIIYNVLYSITEYEYRAYTCDGNKYCMCFNSHPVKLVSMTRKRAWLSMSFQTRHRSLIIYK